MRRLLTFISLLLWFTNIFPQNVTLIIRDRDTGLPVNDTLTVYISEKISYKDVFLIITNLDGETIKERMPNNFNIISKKIILKGSRSVKLDSNPELETPFRKNELLTFTKIAELEFSVAGYENGMTTTTYDSDRNFWLNSGSPVISITLNPLKEQMK